MYLFVEELIHEKDGKRAPSDPETNFHCGKSREEWSRWDESIPSALSLVREFALICWKSSSFAWSKSQSARPSVAPGA